ncbi:MAG TPA: phosphatase PAP2-related protein [Candidatus Paceibacterota bacterium]|nr:phosphatase PAP2-related protein [Candidatus Paceibacterota bacterium]
METQQPDSFTLKDLFKPEHRYSLLGAFFLLCLAYIAEHFANLYEIAYSLRPTSTYVGDLLLDNLPVVNLNFIIIEGALLSIVVGTIFVLLRPRYVLFALKSLALFVAIRALFVSLTHVGIYPGSINPGAGILDGIYTYLNFQTGFFFSGHTALPFLMALIFWEERPARIVLLSLSFVFGTAVLLAHIHYSIDVFAAPFMAYGIFNIARHLFPHDWELIEGGF